MVRLKAKMYIAIRTLTLYFNSTMVRLKGKSAGIDFFVPKFQFHYGTIKRREDNAAAR